MQRSFVVISPVINDDVSIIIELVSGVESSTYDSEASIISLFSIGAYFFRDMLIKSLESIIRKVSCTFHISLGKYDQNVSSIWSVSLCEKGTGRDCHAKYWTITIK